MEQPQTRAKDLLGLEDSDGDNGSSAEEEEWAAGRARHRLKRRRMTKFDDDDDDDDDDNDDNDDNDDDDDDDDDDGGDSTDDGGNDDPKLAQTNAPLSPAEPAEAAEGREGKGESAATITNASKLKPLTQAELAAAKAATAKTGVVYLSRIPPFMKPQKVRDLLGRFGKIGRVFLAPEDPKAHSKRVKYGGNKKRNFIEGWVEFASKKEARLCAETLNTQIVGGKKGSYYHDDLWNIKYLPKFKWHHLQAQIGVSPSAPQAVQD